MSQPRAALGSIIVSAGCADHQSELRFPVDPFRAVRDVEAVRYPKPGMRVNLLPGELVGADIQATPALCVSNETGHRHGAFDHGWQRIADLDGFPESRFGTANRFVVIMPVNFGELSFTVAPDRLRFQVGIFGALFAGGVAVGAKTPTVGLRDQSSVLIEEPHVIDLLHGAAGETSLMLDQVLEPGFRGNLVIAAHRFVPG